MTPCLEQFVFFLWGIWRGVWLNSLGMIYHTALRGSSIYLSSCIWFNTYGCMPLIIQCYFSHLYTLHLFIEQINWSPVACYLWLCLLAVWKGFWSCFPLPTSFFTTPVPLRLWENHTWVWRIRPPQDFQEGEKDKDPPRSHKEQWLNHRWSKKERRDRAREKQYCALCLPRKH